MSPMKLSLLSNQPSDNSTTQMGISDHVSSLNDQHSILSGDLLPSDLDCATQDQSLALIATESMMHHSSDVSSDEPAMTDLYRILDAGSLPLEPRPMPIAPSDEMPTSIDLPCQQPEKIPGPLNCFLTYRRDVLANVTKQYPDHSSRAISGVIADLWKNEPENIKEHYKSIASKERALHKLQYPNYKRVLKKPKSNAVARRRSIPTTPYPNPTNNNFSPLSPKALQEPPSPAAQTREYHSRMELFWRDPEFMPDNEMGNPAVFTASNLSTASPCDNMDYLLGNASEVTSVPTLLNDFDLAFLDRRASCISMPLFPLDDDISQRSSRRFSCISDAFGCFSPPMTINGSPLQKEQEPSVSSDVLADFQGNLFVDD